ncbi:conserved Plasmodium protein, unknown function [Plasmodium knowlesi strain H]|uniref:ORC1/DEAH AAA+ ATPase domain-containing protein n=3 Tax=Plasmodium knowlesi TaxID=5850 RepID=A0A5K1V538_PLAKH|nr:conserved Plasmodium protein, unknown function [Plasmodium knowlesi strain H]OTN66999.1 Uncharacterized protein PKNOH_S07468700 [Plasmodium knowlesi]CAA9988811.1 conserved Plasmodium protein, unknown function [Plasmodium knowlesi strain H]SBO21806.1 conserved Plasmodium protein, unknown function [Plasmodium knowlesi strain H]SBO22180.1 conserved Plasmodium protein, unknown function [Plasmodium knowlesi strain H]VVS78285.1 conserved Plasmodium protein, unknown function [Plasmodium knowlesi s|eukprot:XP_002259790.1 hypothetical protein, conserved in Plasmodium species [Plasmodium knowlesi strain H]
MKAASYASSNLSKSKEEENKSRSKSGAKLNEAKKKEHKKITTLVQMCKEDTDTKQINRKKINPKGIKKDEENSIDAIKVEENIKKIEKYMNKLEEIEKKIIDDINECNKYIEVYEKAKTLLDSKDFDSDVGREAEIDEIRKILKRCSENVDGEGIFLTGPSGQGKTYSIFYIIKEIEKEKEKNQKSDERKKKKGNENTSMQNYKNIDASYFYVSCSNSQKPYDIFVDILQQIIKKDKKTILTDVKHRYNLNGLEEVKKVFINYTSKLNNLKIVIVDELDFIATKNVRMELKTKNAHRNFNEDVVKNLFECVQTKNSKIILVGIANSLDLIKDYKHMKINQIIYKPYNEKQFMNIVRNKLNTLEEEFVTKIFKGVSLNIHVRQISNRNGDIRSCFDAILRVFSDKKSDLDERKKNLTKLKEEVMMNIIFSRQEKRNLFLLLADQGEDHSTSALNGDETEYSQSEQPEVDTHTRGKRKATNEKEDQANDTYCQNSYTHRIIKKQKVYVRNTSNLNYQSNSDQTEDNFFLEQNVTPLPNLHEFELANKFSDKAKNLKFTDQKNEFSIGYETLKKEVIKIQNNNETLSEILIRKNYNTNDDNSFYSFSQCTPKRCYESPFKVLYKNEIDSEIPHFKDKKEVLQNIKVEKLQSFDVIVDNQIKSIEKKYHEFLDTAKDNTVLIADIKKITDKIPLEEHKDILFKIKSLPLIQKFYLYASCNVVNDTHLNSDDEKNDCEEKKQNTKQLIEITYADIQRGFRSLCSNLSETSYIRDILEGNTIDQAIEHFEELGILTNCRKNQKVNERKSVVKVPKGLTPRFANMKNNRNFSSHSKMNTVYYFNLPVCVIKQTLKEISSILSSFDRNAEF